MTLEACAVLTSSETGSSLWPHRLAVVLACATFPLIWVGGLVTTYDAGMAVPDWPSTYGYNLFAYPLAKWWAGPWDLFIEHGHRLLGAMVGMLALALLASAFASRCSRRLRIMAVVAVVLVIFQGLLGGARVIANARTLAQIHGCVGPAFFAYCVVLAAAFSRSWRCREHRTHDASSVRKLRRLSTITAVLTYTQLVLGSGIRHVPVMASANHFRVLVVFHLLGAMLLAVHVVLLAIAAVRGKPKLWSLNHGPVLLALLVAMQLVLGVSTWVVNFGWPAWFDSFAFAANYTILAAGFWPAIIITSHVAMGSLILALAVLACVNAWRLQSLSGGGLSGGGPALDSAIKGGLA